MCDNAFEWARERNKVRKNAIHKCEEADLPYDDFWSVAHENGERIEISATAEVDVS